MKALNKKGVLVEVALLIAVVGLMFAVSTLKNSDSGSKITGLAVENETAAGNYAANDSVFNETALANETFAGNETAANETLSINETIFNETTPENETVLNETLPANENISNETAPAEELPVQLPAEEPAPVETPPEEPIPPEPLVSIEGAITPDASTVGLWHFDEGTGNISYDSSGYGNNGSLTEYVTGGTCTGGGQCSLSACNDEDMCTNWCGPCTGVDPMCSDPNQGCGTDEDTCVNGCGCTWAGSPICSWVPNVAGPGPAWTSSSRFGSYALNFDGKNDYDYVAGSDSLKSPFAAGNITMAAWFKLNKVPSAGAATPVLIYGSTGGSNCKGGVIAVDSTGFYGGFQQLNTPEATWQLLSAQATLSASPTRLRVGAVLHGTSPNQAGQNSIFYADDATLLNNTNPVTLSNSGFETWTNGAGPFTTVGATTADSWILMQEGMGGCGPSASRSTIYKSGSYGLKWDITGCWYYNMWGDGGIYQNITNYASFASKTMNFSIWMKNMEIGGGPPGRAFIDDGVTRTYSADYVLSDPILFKSSAVSAGQWYHVAWTFANGSIERLYVNGAEVANKTPVTTLDAPSQVYNLVFGTDSFAANSGGGACGAGTYLNGTIDQVVIYNRTLSAAEILNLYQTSNNTPVYSGFNGSTTNFSSVSDIENVPQPTIEKTGYGKIRWNGNINASNADFSNIQLSNNFVRVNSAGLNPSFNTSANVTIYNGRYANALPLWDPEDDGTFVICPSNVCSNIAYAGGVGGNLTFTAAHFTSYSGGGNVTSCGSINGPGQYYLTQSINNVAGTCITINNNSIMLDCQGYTIDGDDSDQDAGVYNSGFANVTVKNCHITDFWRGIYFYWTGTNNGTIMNNTVSSNTDAGICIAFCGDNTLINNTANSNTNSGIYIRATSSGNNLISNIASSNGRGIILSYSSNNVLTNNIANGTGQQDGIYLESTSGNNLTNNIAQNNIDWDFNSDSDSVNNTIINLTTQQNLISFTSNAIALKGLKTENVPSDSLVYRNITKYLNITSTAEGSWIYLNVSYNGSNVPIGVNESKLKIYKYNTTSANWQLANTSSGVNGVDTTNKVVYADITEFGSTFAPLGQVISGGQPANYTKFNGSTTNFNSVPDINNISQPVLERVGYGKIRWNGNVNASGADFDSYVTITSNFVKVNSSGLHPSFNTSANVTIYNISYANALPLWDPEDDGTFVICPSNVCSNIAYAGGVGGNLSFTTAHFTSFSGGGNVTSCGSIDGSGQYYLTQNISTAGICITIINNSISLDCQGNKINGTGASTYGIDINGYDNATIRNCSMQNLGQAITFENGADSETLIENSLTSNQIGLVIDSSSNSSITDNAINSNTAYGIQLMNGANNNTFANNSVDLNTQYGFRIASSNNNYFVNNTIYSNAYGFGIMTYSANNTLAYSAITLNSQYGIYIADNAVDNKFINNNATDNGIWDFRSETLFGNNIITNLTAQQNLISFLSERVSIKGLTTTQAPTNPTNHYNISKYLNITDNGGGGWLLINISYDNNTDIPVNGNESTLAFWKYNETSANWFKVAGTNGVDLANKIVYANITDFGSTFAPLGKLNATEAIPLLVCMVNESCAGGYTDILHMSNLTNTHAELPNESDYVYKVCCKDNSSIVTIGTSSAGTMILKLSNSTNAHVALPSEPTYAYPVYISASTGGISCSASDSGCSGNQTCLATISNDENAHIADCVTAPYSKAICCELSENIIPSLPYEINTSNTYILNESLNVSGNGITINADDVTIDCASNEIIGNNNTGYGIHANNINRVTIRNCIISNFTSNDSGAIMLNNSNDSLVRGNVLFNNRKGIVAYQTLNSSLIENTISDVDLTEDSTFGSAVAGVYIVSSNSINVTDNDISNISGSGISFTTVGPSNDNNYLEGNSIDASNNGISLTALLYSQINSNDMTNNNIGLAFSSSSSNNISSNDISNSVIRGIDVQSSDSNNFVTNTIGNSGINDLRINNSFANSFINLTASNENTSTTFDLSGENITLDATGSLPANEPGYANITHYLDLTNLSADSWAFLKISYTDAEIASAGINNENALAIWKYSSGWTNIGFYNANGVDATNNFVYANITDFGSTFAPLADAQAPGWSDNKTSPALPITYSPAQNYQFNITWTDNTGVIDTVLFENNFTGSAANYSPDGSSGNEYFYNYGALPAGSYYWKSWANDTAGNLNVTDIFEYQIDKLTSSCSLTFDPINGSTYPVSVNASCSCDNPEASATLFRNDNDVSLAENNIFMPLAAGTYDYVCNVSETENYTAASAASSYQINQFSSALTLIITPSLSESYLTATTANCTANNAEIIPQLYRNGTLVSGAYESLILAAGSYNYSCNAIGNENYTAPDEVSSILDIAKASTTTELRLNGTQSNLTVNYPTQVNASATTSALAVLLFRNGLNVTDENGQFVTLAASITPYNYSALNPGNENYSESSETWFATVNQAASICSLTFDPVSGTTYPVNLNASCSCDNPEASATLFRDTVDVTGENNFLVPLAAGTYAYVCNASATENYSYAEDSSSYTINQSASSLTLSIAPSLSETYLTATAANCTSSTPQIAPQLYRNGTLISGAYESLVLAAGSYNYSCNAIGNENYTAPDEQSSILTINQLTPSCSLTFDPASGGSYPVSVNASCSCTNPEASANLYRNGTDVTLAENNVFTALAAGDYGYVCNASESQNYTTATSSSSYIVNQATPTLTISALPAATVHNGTATNVSCSADTAQVAPLLYRNGTGVSNPDVQTLPIGDYNYSCSSAATENYSAAETSKSIVVTSVTPAFCSLTFDPASGLIYPVSVNASCSCDNPETTATLFRDTNDVTIAENDIFTPLAAGTYNYVCNASETENYSYAEDLNSYQINKSQTSVNLSLNGVESDIIIPYPTALTAVFSTNVLTADMFRNGTNIDAENNAPIILAAGSYNYTVLNPGDENYSESSKTFIATINQATPTVSISLTPSNSVSYPTATTANCTSSTSQIAPQLYRNGTYVGASYETLTLAAGSYNYSCNATGTENYTAPDEQSSILNIAKATPSCSLTFDPINGSIYPVSVNASCSCDNPEASATLFRDTVDVTGENNFLVPLAAGTYAYVCNASATENYSYAEDSSSYTINQSASSLTLSIAPSLSETYLTATAANCTSSTPQIAPQLYRNGTLVSGAYESLVLAAGSYNYSCNAIGNENYTAPDEQSSIVDIAKATPGLTLNSDPAWTVKVGYQTNVSCDSDTPQISPLLFRDGINVTNPDVQNLTINNYSYVCNNSETENYTTATASNTLIVTNLNIANCSLSFSPLSPQDYTPSLAINASCSCDNPEASATLFRDGMEVTGFENNVLTLLAANPAGYNYVCNASQTQNFSYAQNASAYTINRAASSINLYLNGSASNFTRVARHIVNITSALTTPVSGIVEIFEDGTSLSLGSSPLEVLKNYTAAGEYNITAVYNETQNYSASSATQFLTIIAAANYSSFNGSTTNFNDAPNISNVCQPVLEVAAKGKIVWDGCIDAAGADFDSYAHIGSNLATVNSSGLNPSFNSSANITVYRLNFTNPKIQVDYADNGTFVDCLAPLCSEISYTGSNTGGKNFTFKVQHFTTYRIVQSPTLGGGGGAPAIGDIIPPVIVFIAPTPGDQTVTNSTQIDIWVNVTDDHEIATVVLEFDSGKKSMGRVALSNSWKYTVEGLEDGTYSYRVFADDESGNRGYSESRVLTVQTAPAVEQPVVVEVPTLPQVPAPEQALAKVDVCSLLPPIAYSVAVLIALSLVMYAVFTYGLHKEHRKGWLYLTYSLVIFDVIVLGYHWLSCKELLLPVYIIVAIAAFLPVIAALIPPKKSSDMLLKEAVKKNFKLGFSERMVKMSLESRGWNKTLVNRIVKQARRELIEEGSLR